MARQPGDARRRRRDLRALSALRAEDHRGGRRDPPGGKAAMSPTYLLPNGRVLRYTFRERLMHWLAGISYVYLLLTGLAFWSPWLYWIAYILGGPTISRAL